MVEVQETLKAETPAHFGAQVTRYVNTYVGEGLYTQEAPIFFVDLLVGTGAFFLFKRAQRS